MRPNVKHMGKVSALRKGRIKETHISNINGYGYLVIQTKIQVLTDIQFRKTFTEWKL